MTVERTYVAIYLGDGSISVLSASMSGVVQQDFDTAVSLDSGELTYLDDAGQPDYVGEHDVGERDVGEHDVGEHDAERFPWCFVDDPEMMIGSTGVPSERVFQGIVAEAMYRVGATLPADLLEIACPSSWGSMRRNVVRHAAMPLAREVLVGDAATAAAQSVGERASAFAVVVELGELGSTVSSLTAATDSDSTVSVSPDAYVRSGRWNAVGTRDIDAGPGTDRIIRDAVAGYVATQHRGDAVPVFLLDGSWRPAAREILADGGFRVHRLFGRDVVRSMAARMGISEFTTEIPLGAETGAPGPGGRVPGNAETHRHPPIAQASHTPVPDPELSEAFLPYAAPSSPRAAAWLDDAHTPPRSDRPTALIALGVAAALVLAVVAFVGVRSLQHNSVPTAQPAEMVSPLTEARAISTSTTPPTTAPETTTATADPTPGPVTHEHGRASIRLPPMWTERPEDGRLLLLPPDGPDRRILLTTVDLAPGVSLDDVADDLAGQIDERGEQTTIDTFSRRTDFGGRVGISYVEAPGDGSVVHWRVFVEGGVQIGLGCQSRAGEEAVLEGDCGNAISTLQVTQ